MNNNDKRKEVLCDDVVIQGMPLKKFVKVDYSNFTMLNFSMPYMSIVCKINKYFNKKNLLLKNSLFKKSKVLLVQGFGIDVSEEIIPRDEENILRDVKRKQEEILRNVEPEEDQEIEDLINHNIKNRHNEIIESIAISGGSVDRHWFDDGGFDRIPLIINSRTTKQMAYNSYEMSTFHMNNLFMRNLDNILNCQVNKSIAEHKYIANTTYHKYTYNKTPPEGSLELTEQDMRHLATSCPTWYYGENKGYHDVAEQLNKYWLGYHKYKAKYNKLKNITDNLKEVKYPILENKTLNKNIEKMNNTYNIIHCNELYPFLNSKVKDALTAYKSMHSNEGFLYYGYNKTQFFCFNEESKDNSTVAIVNIDSKNSTDFINVLSNDPLNFYEVEVSGNDRTTLFNRYLPFMRYTHANEVKLAGSKIKKIKIDKATDKVIKFETQVKDVTESTQSIKWDIAVKDLVWTGAGLYNCYKDMPVAYKLYCGAIPIIDLGLEQLGISNKYYLSSVFNTKAIIDYVSDKIPEKIIDLLAKITNLEKKEIVEVEMLPVGSQIRGSATGLGDKDAQPVMHALTSTIEQKTAMLNKRAEEYNNMIDKIINVGELGVSTTLAHYSKGIYDYAIDTVVELGSKAYEYTNNYYYGLESE